MENSFSFIPRAEIDIGHTAKIKRFPDGSASVLVCTRPIFRTDGWEAVDKVVGSVCEQSVNESDPLARSRRRARARLREIARSTAFSYFVTLTLDKEKINRYEVEEILRKLNVWLDNNVRRRGLTYALVPERHKDGAIHFHGFFNDALPVVDSGKTDGGGHRIFNLPRWGFGFSTAIELYGDYRRAVAYVCKYIGKESEKIGGRWYYSGGAIGSPVVELADFPFSEAVQLMRGALIFDAGGAQFAAFEMEPGEILDFASLQFSESQVLKKSE